ncbi:MAG: RidA family protein [Actinobacteria bacterium]|nr:RidA family protein [Actinomycetota bacterium]NBY15337.1 RidA family protein [Actinomycetota bacterium]
MTSVVENRLAELGITLPSVAKPVASYIPAKRSGNLIFTSGQLPMKDGQLLATGILEVDVDVDVAYACARQCALNALAAIKELIGDLDKVTQIVKVTGFVASHPTFTNQPAVINGASELLAEVFGDAAAHARSSIGMAVLPLNAPVEVELIVEVSD